MNQPEPQYGQPAPQWQPQNEPYAQPAPYDAQQYGAPRQVPPQQPYAPPTPNGAQPYGAPQQPPYQAPQYQNDAPPQQFPPQQQQYQPSPMPYQNPAAPYQAPPSPYPSQPAPPPGSQPGNPQQYAQAPQAYQQPYMPPASAPRYPQQAPQQQPYPQAPQYPAAPNPAWQQQPMPYQAPAAPAAPPQPYMSPPQAPNPYAPPAAQVPAPAMSFPPPTNLSTPRDKLVDGARPFLEPGEAVYYGFILKLDDTIEPTPRELMIAIEGQHHILGALDSVNNASGKLNKGLSWMRNPLEAASERLVEQGNEALSRRLHGPVFAGGWESQAGWFIRYVRATSDQHGPGAWGVLTDRRYLIFRAGRAGGSAMRLVHAVPRTAIAGVRTEGTKDAALHGRSPRAELHFTDGSMVATMMPTKQSERVAAIIAVQHQQQPPRY